MSDEHDDAVIQGLIERLNRGDEQAVRDVFETYGPYLRMVVRRRLSSPMRTKLDSEDIVQSIWADLIDVFRGGGDRFPDAVRLQAFLARAARNRLVDRQRQHSTSLRVERPATDSDLAALESTHHERPSEAAQADELWARMLAACPPNHRELLLMRREGRSLDEIAARSGLHPSSVRRIFYDLAGRFGVEKIARDPRPSPRA